MVAVGSIIFYSINAPYRDLVCSKVQLASLISLAFTYAAALVLFQAPGARARRDNGAEGDAWLDIGG